MNEWVLITGSSKGLGKELGLIFAENKYNIVLHGRNESDLNDVQKKILEKRVECEIVMGDLNSNETIEKLSLIGREKNISILINNAAEGSLKLFQDFNGEDFERILNTNLISVMKLTRNIYELFLEKRSGKIINLNSLDGITVNKDLRTIYSASKFGLKGFTDALRYEAKKSNIRVIGVYLGGMNTSMYSNNNSGVGGMDPLEVAKKIFSVCEDESSLGVDEVTINRKSY